VVSERLSQILFGAVTCGLLLLEYFENPFYIVGPTRFKEKCVKKRFVIGF